MPIRQCRKHGILTAGGWLARPDCGCIKPLRPVTLKRENLLATSSKPVVEKQKAIQDIVGSLDPSTGEFQK